MPDPVGGLDALNPAQNLSGGNQKLLDVFNKATEEALQTRIIEVTGQAKVNQAQSKPRL